MKPFEQQTYYEILEIPVTAPDDEIRAAYERAIEMYSPDSIAVYTLVDPGQIDALRARLTEAMEILTEPDLRAEYDRMIGVSRAGANSVVNLASSLAEAASAVQPQAPAAAAPEPVTSPAPVSAPEASSQPAPAAAEASPAPALAPSEPPTAPARKEAATEAPPAAPPSAVVPAPPEQPVVPVTVTPGQIHAAFRSYSLSYVPLMVQAPSVTSAVASSPFAPSEPPPPAQEAPREVPAAVSQAPSTAPASEAAPSPVSAAPVEPAPVPSAPVAVTAEPPLPMAAQAAEAPSRPPEPEASVATAATPAQPAPEGVPHEEEEVSGVRAPMPSPKETRPASSRPGSSHGRYSRVSTTPPPVPPGARRTPHAAPTAQPGRPVAGSGQASARPAQGAGMALEEAQQLSQESAIATAEAALAQVSAKAREPRPKPLDLPPNAEFNGEVLRQVREHRGLSLHQLAERTRISSKHLENVEADRYAALPATVYLRGILMNIARELGLDPLRVSRSYLALAAEPKKK